MSPLGELAVNFCVYAALGGLTAMLAEEFLGYQKSPRILHFGKDAKKVGEPLSKQTSQLIATNRNQIHRLRRRHVLVSDREAAILASSLILLTSLGGLLVKVVPERMTDGSFCMV